VKVHEANRVLTLVVKGGRIMKRTVTLLTLVVAGLFVVGLVAHKQAILGVVPSAQAGQGCSVATLQGDYLVTGEAMARIDQREDPTFPRVVLAVHIFDGKGGVTGFTTLSRGGDIVENPVQSTHTLDSDCTGLLTSEDGSRWRIVVTRDGREGAYIRIDPGAIATRHIRKR
jgi:hypothetical protein